MHRMDRMGFIVTIMFFWLSLSYFFFFFVEPFFAVGLSRNL